MASDINELLDMLYDTVSEAKSVPLSNERCIVEREKVLSLIEDIKYQFPTELDEAKKLIATRDQYLEKARREAESLRKQAESEAKRLLDKDELTARVRQQGNEIIRKAEERSRELRRSANQYCEDVLRRTEEAVGEAREEIKRARTNFRTAAASSTPATGQPGRPSIDIPADDD